MPKVRGSFIPDYDSLRSYTRGGCHLAGRSAGSCQDNEFQYDSKSCGLLTNQAKCRSLYDVKCKFNELDGTVKGWTNPLPGNSSKPAENPYKGDPSPPVTCEFERTPFFTNVDQIHDWNRKFTTTDKDIFYYDEAIKEFCSGTVSNCQALDADVCSRWTSTGPEGSFCEEWAQANKDKADNAFKNYCGNSVNFNNADCACINAYREDENFNLIRQAVGIGADHCWYTPCASPGVLNTFEDKSNPCPTAVCNIINQFIKDKQVNIKDLKQSTHCKINEGGGGGTPGGGGDTPGGGGTPGPGGGGDTPDSKSWIDKIRSLWNGLTQTQKNIIMIVLFLVLVLLALLM